MISVVFPVYNERDNLEPLLEEVEATLNSMEWEVIAVDDRSTDGSLQELRRLRMDHKSLRVVSLDRHAGQSAAFAAGVELARGDPVVLMDADGQNDPADVPALLEMLENDPDCAAVAGYRVARADSRWKRIQSRVANNVRNLLTGDRVRDTGCSLKVVRKAALQSLVSFDGMHRFLPTLIRQAGGKVVEAPVSHRPRLSGKSKYGMWNRGMVALRDAIGVRWLMRRALEYKSREEID
jgi:glycosyltransferase involved in cell wall biosynthesis